MEWRKILFAAGASMLLAGAVVKPFYDNFASYAYLFGAILFAVMQFLLRYRDGDFIIRRLVGQQLLGAAALVLSGILMFTTFRNEWILAMTVGALLQLYTAFRIPQEIEKKKNR